MKRLFLICLLSCLVWSGSCGSLIPSDREKSEKPDRAERVDLLTRLEHLSFKNEYRAVSETGRQYLDRVSGTDIEGKFRILVAEAELELNNPSAASAMIEPVLEGDYPETVKGDAALIKARLNLIRGNQKESIENILYSTVLKRNEAHISRAEKILKENDVILTAGEIRDLADSYGSSPLLELLLERHYRDSPEDRGIIEDIRAEGLAEDSLKAPRKHPPLRVGLICPLSGKYEALGRSFIRGAYVALKEGRRNGIDNIELVIGNTRASALETQIMTRRLINGEKVDIILGGISNSSTVAAAQVAQSAETVIFSPVSNLEGIAAIGDYVFQTTVDYELEIIALARVAVRNLGIERIAFLAADTPFNREMEILFREEVEREGALLCEAEYYEEGSTDFRDNIEKIREKAPEALFIPAERNDLVLILPQLSFYEFGVQLLGLSRWDSSDLIYMSGKDMSGAVFPAETRQERDRELYLSAAAFVNEPAEKVNHFEIRGYIGMRQIVNSISGMGGEASVKERMKNVLNRKVHPFIRVAGGEGITFYTIRNEEKNKFLTYKFTTSRRN